MIDFNTEFGQKVKRHIEKEYFIWLTTLGADLTPQPRPVWFAWETNSFLVYSQPGAYKVAHIRRHPHVALHFNADARADQDVIVFTGRAEIDGGAPPAHEALAYFEKYAQGIAGLGMTPGEFSREYATAIRVKVEKVRGW